MNRSDALAGVIKDRWEITPTAEVLQWLHEIQFRRSTPPVGGTQESPWSDSTWLLWIKKRIDEFSANPTLASDPANRYGPPFEVGLDPANVAACAEFSGPVQRGRIGVGRIIRVVRSYPPRRDRSTLDGVCSCRRKCDASGRIAFGSEATTVVAVLLLCVERMERPRGCRTAATACCPLKRSAGCAIATFRE